ncbi:MAG: hypothetical protein AAGH92_11830, partial [Planctomycetota bacterium]
MKRSGLHHVKIEAVDWCAVLPVLRIFQLARPALQPTKLVIAWLIVTGVYLGGVVLAWPLDEVDAQVLMSPAAYSEALNEFQQAELPPLEGSDVLQVWLADQLASLWALADAVTTLDLGLTGGGVLGAAHALAIEGPLRLWRSAPGYIVAFAAWSLLVSVVLGLGVARLAALQLARHRTVGPVEALGFIARKGVWTLLAPALPLIVVAGGAVLLIAAGFVLFNLPIVEWLGGLAYGLLLLVGLAMALLLIVLAVGLHLLVAAMAVEGTDAFDAVSRCF